LAKRKKKKFNINPETGKPFCECEFCENLKYPSFIPYEHSLAENLKKFLSMPSLPSK
jgi:hypothetical protein